MLSTNSLCLIIISLSLIILIHFNLIIIFIIINSYTIWILLSQHYNVNFIKAVYFF